MAVYKVIQDIEAEDKLLGPLTLKAFVYAGIAGSSAFIDFRLLLAGSLGPMRFLVMLVFLGPMLLFGVLASPLGREQPTEVWLLARLKFLLKPRQRIWDQAGLTDYVTITAPKKPEAVLTKNLSQNEVKSRLSALAATLDSRGWAVKGQAVNIATAPAYANPLAGDTERLVESEVIKAQPQVVDVHESDDILDSDNNPTAQKFDNMMQEAEEARRAALQAQLEAVRAQANIAAAEAPKQDPNALTADEQAVLNQLHQRDKKLDSARVIKGGVNPVTGAGDTAKLELAQSGSAFKVSTLSQLANR